MYCTHELLITDENDHVARDYHVLSSSHGSSMNLVLLCVSHDCAARVNAYIRDCVTPTSEEGVGVAIENSAARK